MKRILNLIVCAVSLNAVGQIPEYVPASGIVAWYDLDDNAADDGLLENHLQIQGATSSTDRFMNDSGALYFDGGATLHAASFTGVGENSSHTISFWETHGSIHNGCVLSETGGNSTGNKLHYCFRGPDDGVCIDGGCMGLDFYSSQHFTSFTAELDNWNHWVLTYESGSQNSQIFLNGDLVSEQPMPTSWTGTFDEGICLGAFCQSNGDGSHFIGSLDDFGIWDRPLSPLEIEGLYSWTPFGCTDDNACNYSPNANVDDGSCTYHHIVEESIITSCDSYYWNEMLLTEGGTFSTVELNSIEGLIYGGYFDGAHYLISNDVMEWSDGEALAESLGGWLCVLNTEEELDFVMNSMAEFFTPASATNGASSGAWIGLYNQEWINGESGIMWPCVHFDGDGAFGMLNLNDELYPGGSAAPCFSDEQESWFDVASIIEIPSDSICDAVSVLNLTLLSCADVQTFCGAGTIWDSETSQCVIEDPCGWNPDSDDDSLVGVSDLLMFLSVFGSEWPVFNCGDPVLYQGYEYETVQIGEQCWFAENLRSENYRNGDAIPTGLSDADWQAAEAGAVAIYQNDESYLTSYGRLYNWYAVTDARSLCSTGWHVPSDEEWTVLTSFLGGESEAGFKMKTTYGWNDAGNGSNESNFSGLPGGGRGNDGSYAGADFNGRWYSSSQNGTVAWNRDLIWDTDGVDRNSSSHTGGYSIRCIKD